MTNLTKESKVLGLYRFVWRWHFFAGIIMGPILILLAITGAIYLFKPYLEPLMDRPLYYVEQSDTKQISPTEQLQSVKNEFPGATISTFTNPVRPDFSTQVGISLNDEAYTVFVNPYSGYVLGKLKDSDRLQQIIIQLHGSLMQGENTWGDWLIELSASWAIILLLTGLYLYWPRNKQTFFSIWRIRWKSDARTVLRDIHSNTAFWMTVMILLLVLTGLPWAGFFGQQLDRLVQWTNTPYYDWSAWDAKSDMKMKDVAKTAWANENFPVPKSVYLNSEMIPLEKVIIISNQERVHPGYTVNFPNDETGSYVVSIAGWEAESYKNYATLAVDQYSGKVLADSRWKDYSPLVKTVEFGIAFHEGRLFGWPNMLVNLIACVSLVLITMTGVMMWWKRRPKDSIGVPQAMENYKLSLGVILITVILCILLPIAGISIAIIFLLDQVMKIGSLMFRKSK